MNERIVPDKAVFIENVIKYLEAKTKPQPGQLDPACAAELETILIPEQLEQLTHWIENRNPPLLPAAELGKAIVSVLNTIKSGPESEQSIKEKNEAERKELAWKEIEDFVDKVTKDWGDNANKSPELQPIPHLAAPKPTVKPLLRDELQKIVLRLAQNSSEMFHTNNIGDAVEYINNILTNDDDSQTAIVPLISREGIKAFISNSEKKGVWSFINKNLTIDDLCRFEDTIDLCGIRFSIIAAHPSIFPIEKNFITLIKSNAKDFDKLREELQVEESALISQTIAESKEKVLSREEFEKFVYKLWGSQRNTVFHRLHLSPPKPTLALSSTMPRDILYGITVRLAHHIQQNTGHDSEMFHTDNAEDAVEYINNVITNNKDPETVIIPLITRKGLKGLISNIMNQSLWSFDTDKDINLEKTVALDGIVFDIIDAVHPFVFPLDWNCITIIKSNVKELEKLETIKWE